MYYKVWVASQSFHGNDSLTYQSEGQFSIGQVVAVPLQRKIVRGIVAGPTTKPSFTTKKIMVAWPLSVPEQLMQLMSWLSSYYPAPLGMIVEFFVPPALPKKLMPLPIVKLPTTTQSLSPLTKEQAKVLTDVHTSKASSLLLHGDTGTGKTRLYIELALSTINSGRSCLILTPEIGLTTQLRNMFEVVFGNRVLVTHSDMTPANRRQIWQRVHDCDAPLIIIGPRSALFMPLSNIGLIVVDEAHDTAYKQEQAPYYQATRVAAQLAHLHKARLILGSATPLVADYFSFEQKKLPILRMTQSALPISVTATHQLIDSRESSNFTRSAWLASLLLLAIDEALQNSQQVLLFLNRRGSARLILCRNCGWQAMCPHCDVPLTYHQDSHTMRCHSCNFVDKTPSACPSCRAAELLFLSIGTKALESEMHRLYPNANIARFDRDTPLKLRLSNQYKDLHSGAINMVIGTQTVAKGLDLPKLSVVGIIQADSGLQIPDYTSNERTFQLISQVSGRVGRGHLPGKLFIQSFHPDSPLIAQSITKDYQAFYKQELAERKLFRFPPYYFLMKVSCIRASSKSAQAACHLIAKDIRKKHPQAIVEGPTPRFIEKIAGKFGWHLVIKATRRGMLTNIIHDLPSNCIYDIDPSTLL